MKTIPYFGTNLIIDEKATLSEMKAAEGCELFFKNSRKGEKKTVYRGCLIISQVQDFTGAAGTVCYHVYAFDTRLGALHSIGSGSSLEPCCTKNIRNMADCKRRVDETLDAENPPLSMSSEEFEVTIPVKVKATYCRNDKGQMTHVEIDDYLSIDNKRAFYDKDNLGGMFAVAIAETLAKTLSERFNKKGD